MGASSLIQTGVILDITLSTSSLYGARKRNKSAFGALIAILAGASVTRQDFPRLRKAIRPSINFKMCLSFGRSFRAAIHGSKTIKSIFLADKATVQKKIISCVVRLQTYNFTYTSYINPEQQFVDHLKRYSELDRLPRHTAQRPHEQCSQLRLT
ncbi:hypothetical protein SFRURICE_015935 [Spodoptera frugiperda]|nr:hypothetical protein SFRURICE_015935 [Spodoptera frugiperda]